MFSWLAALQPLMIGAVLLWAAGFKLLSRHASGYARRSALAGPLGEQRAVIAYRTLGGVELLIGALLLAPPAWWGEAAAAAALSVAFLGYLGYAKATAPDSSCGCLSANAAPVTWRSFARGGLLLAAAGLALTTGTAWPSALSGHPTGATAVIAAELALMVLFSPELDGYWLVPLRQLRFRLTHPLGQTAGFAVPLESTLHQLHRSSGYRQVAEALRSDVREHWDDDQWRMLLFTADYRGREVSAVFAVPRLRYQPDAVRVALVDEATGETLLSLESSPDDIAPDWAAGPAYA